MKIQILLFLLCTQFVASSASYGADTLYDARFKNWQTQAEQGDPKAQYSLGNAYLRGNEVKKDIDQAISWYEKAAQQGHAKSEYKLGNLYYEGKAVKRDYNKAFQWINKSAKHGYHPGEFLLGTMYGNGQGTNKDLNKALEWLHKAKADNYLPVDKEINHFREMLAAQEEKDRKENVAKEAKATLASTYVAPIAQPKPKPKPIEKAKPEPEPEKTKLASVPTKSEPKKPATTDAKKLLLEGMWKDDAGKPTAYMPSSVNRCEIMHNYYISCASDRQTRENKFAQIQYRVVSKFTDFSAEGQFVAEYTRNVVKVKPLKAEGTPNAGDIPTKGMQPKSIAKCRIVDSNNISCVNDDFKRISFSR